MRTPKVVFVSLACVAALIGSGCTSESDKATGTDTRTAETTTEGTSPSSVPSTPGPKTTTTTTEPTSSTSATSSTTSTTATSTTTLAGTVSTPPPTPSSAPGTTAVTVAGLPACTTDPYVMLARYANGYQQSAAILQKRLVALGYNPGEIDGYLGPTTMDALQQWAIDTDQPLPPYNADGGSVDTDVLNELKIRCAIPDSHCALDIDPGAPAVYSESSKVVQQRLEALGYRPGAADGYFGPRSQGALLNWANDGDKRLRYWEGETQGFSVTDKGFAELGATC